MTAQRWPRKRHPHVGILLMLLPFVLLSLIGQGVMLRQSPGGLTVVLCSVDGPTTLTLDPDTGLPVAPDKVDRCDWATQQAALHAAGPGPFAPPVTLRPAEPARETFAFAPAHDPRGLFARGPPSPV
jgi:hypothetical protein